MNPNLGMRGDLGPCVLLSWRTPAPSVRPLIPPPFRLVEHSGFAFWNIVLCRISRMRPRGIPALLGVSYHHVAYRLLVEAPLARGGALRGLYFLRSDADSRLMAWGGNLTTAFRFHHARIELHDDGTRVRSGVESNSGGMARFAAERSDTFALAPQSCFRSVEESRDLLKYRPLGLSISGDGGRCKVAQVRRDESLWHEDPLRLDSVEAEWEYLRQLGQDELVLEGATIVRPLPYRWQLGRQACLARA